MEVYSNRETNHTSVAWSKRSNLATTINNLSKVQRFACICITGAMKTYPTAAIAVIFDVVLLHIVVEALAKRNTLGMMNERMTRHRS